jgi:histidinol-phosphate aminotransferase
MRLGTVSRRRFAGLLGAGLGGALISPRLGASLALASLRQGMPDDMIQLDSNENPYGPSPAALEAATRSQKVACRYPDGLADDVHDAIARLHGVRREQVILGCGSGEVLRMADMAFLASGKTVVVAEPTFEAVLHYARVTRAEPVKVPLTADYRHDLARMAAACDARTGLVYVCNPNNPTGTIVAGEELARFLERVPRSVTVLLDEAYHHFVEDPRYRSGFELLERFPNLLVVRTFSKIYGMAGMRLGYAVGAKPAVEALGRHAFWSNVNATALAAAMASLEDPELVPRRRQALNDTRRWLCARLDEAGRRYISSEANFLMIDAGGDVEPLIQAFRSRKVLVGRRFPSLPNWLRVTVGTREETAKFLEALRALVPAADAA